MNQEEQNEYFLPLVEIVMDHWDAEITDKLAREEITLGDYWLGLRYTYQGRITQLCRLLRIDFNPALEYWHEKVETNYNGDDS